MSDSFDPYHVWLGIPPDERPPTHYRLLGLREFESDCDAITNAYDQRRVFLRTLQNGKRADLSQKILNEVTRAGVTLLDPEQKNAYDSALRAAKAKAAPPPVARPLPVAPPRAIPLSPRPAMPAPPPQPYPQAGFAPLPHLPMPPHLTSAPPAPYAYVELPSFAPLPQLPTSPSYPPPLVSQPIVEEPEPPAAVILPSPTPVQPILPPPKSPALLDWYSHNLAPKVELLAERLRIPPWAVLSGVASVAAVLMLLLVSSLWNSRRPTPPIAQPAPQPPPVVTPPSKPVAPLPSNPGPENPTPPPSVSPPVETNPTPPVETNPTPPVVPPPITNPAPPSSSEPQTPKVWLADAGSPRVLLRQVGDQWLLRVGPHYTWCVPLQAGSDFKFLQVRDSRTLLYIGPDRVALTVAPTGSTDIALVPSQMLELARGGWGDHKDIPPEIAATPSTSSANWPLDSAWGLAFDQQSRLTANLPPTIQGGEVDFTIEVAVRLPPCDSRQSILELGNLRLSCSPWSGKNISLEFAPEGVNTGEPIHLPTNSPLNLILEYSAARRAFRFRWNAFVSPHQPWPLDQTLKQFHLGGAEGWRGMLMGCRISRGLRYAGRLAIGPAILTKDEQTISLWEMKPTVSDAPRGDETLRDLADPEVRILRTRAMWTRLTPLRTPAEERSNFVILPALDVRRHILIGGCKQQIVGGPLRTDVAEQVLVWAPVTPPGNYLLLLKAARLAGDGGMVVALPVAGKQMLLAIDLETKPGEFFTGHVDPLFNQIQTGYQSQERIITSAETLLAVHVCYTSYGEIQLFLFGRSPQFRWEGRFQVSDLVDANLPFSQGFAFGSKDAALNISSIEVTEPGNDSPGAIILKEQQKLAERLGLKLLTNPRERPGINPKGISSSPPTAAPLSGPPTANQMQAAEARVRARFAAELAADSNPSVLNNLGRQLSAEAQANRDLAESRALLQLAAEFFLRAVNPKQAYQAALMLDQRLEDRSWTEIRRIFLQSRLMFGPGGPIGNTPRDRIQRDAGAQIALKLAELGVLMRNRNYVTDGLADAEAIGIEQPLDAAQRLRLKYLLAGWDEALQAETTLKTNSNDVAAQTTLGRWTCLGLEDFTTGAPLFAKGGTTGVHRIAAREAVAMGDAKKRFDVAEEWRTVSVTDAQEKAAIRRHCLALYQAALPELKASDKLRAEGRIRELEAEKVAPLPFGFQNYLKAPAGSR